MIRSPHVRCATICVAIFAICAAGCKQTETVPGSPVDPQSSWLSKLTFWKSEDDLSEQGMAEQEMDVRMSMARSFERQGQTDQAIKIYRDIVDKDKSRVDACHRLAVLHDKKGDCKISEAFYRAALKKDPENPEIHCDLGYSFYLQRRWQEAEASLRQALALRPDLTRAHINLGLLLARTGRTDESLVEFARAGCPEADARANMAFALMLEERWWEAQQQYELALAVDSQSKAAQDGLRTLHSLNPRLASQEVPYANGHGGSIEAARAGHLALPTGYPQSVNR